MHACMLGSPRAVTFSELHVSSVGLVHAEDDAVASLRLRLITLPHNLGAQELAKWV